MESRRSRLVLFFLYFLLIVNSMSDLGYNITEIVLRISKPADGDSFEKRWIVYSTLLTDFVVFINALAFIYLFKNMNKRNSSRNYHPRSECPTSINEIYGTEKPGISITTTGVINILKGSTMDTHQDKHQVLFDS
jgi:hypothetical protein